MRVDPHPGAARIPMTMGFGLLLSAWRAHMLALPLPSVFSKSNTLWRNDSFMSLEVSEVCGFENLRVNSKEILPWYLATLGTG